MQVVSYIDLAHIFHHKLLPSTSLFSQKVCSGWSKDLRARGNFSYEYKLCTRPCCMTFAMAVDVKSFYGLKRPRSSATDEEEERNTAETIGLL